MSCVALRHVSCSCGTKTLHCTGSRLAGRRCVHRMQSQRLAQGAAGHRPRLLAARPPARPTTPLLPRAQQQGAASPYSALSERADPQPAAAEADGSLPPAAPTALVVGGGVAGLAAALALARAGWAVRVLERARLRTTAFHATAVHLWPEALQALADIDPAVADEARRSGAGRGGGAGRLGRRDATRAAPTPMPRRPLIPRHPRPPPFHTTHPRR